MSLWTPVFSIAFIAFLFAVGNYISVKTKAYISSIIVAVVAFLIFKYSNIIPANVCGTAGLTGMLGAFVIPFCVVDVGTKLDIRKLGREWKTVVTVVVASIGIMIVCFTLGTVVVGWQRACAAIPPLTGALLATTIVQQVAAEAGNAEIGVFVMIVLVLQTIAGLPVATIALKKHFKEIEKKGGWSAQVQDEGIADENSEKKAKRMFIPSATSAWSSDYFVIFKMAIIAYAAYLVGTALAGPTKNIITPTLLYLLFGLGAAELGILERSPLDAAHSRGIIFLALFSVLLSTFESVTLEVLLSQIGPSIIIIIVGLIGITLLAVVAAKIFKVSPWLSIAIGTCCYLGYPGSQIVVEETIRGSMLSENDAKLATQRVLPKMIIGYVATSIVSIICAGIVAPMIFR